MAAYACKCVACGKKLLTTQAYSMQKGSKNQYFCSEQEYKEYTQKKIFAVRDERRLWSIVEYIIDHHTTNYSLKKYIKEWVSEPYAVDAIDMYKDDVKDIISRKYFDNEYFMIRYVQAVINNNLYDWIKDYKAKQERERTRDKCSDSDLYEIRGYPKRKTKCWDDFE